MRSVVEGRSFEVWGGEQLRDFTYVDDAVEAFLLAALTPEADGMALNIGGDDVVSLSRLAQMLEEVAGGSARHVLREFPAERKRIDIGDYYADDSLARGILGWEHTVGLRQGLARTVDYYRQHLEEYL